MDEDVTYGQLLKKIEMLNNRIIDLEDQKQIIK